MPKRKIQEPALGSRSRWRNKGLDKSRNPTKNTARDQHASETANSAAVQGPYAFSKEQLAQVSQVVVDILAKQNQHAPNEPTYPSMAVDESETDPGTEPDFLSDNYLAQTPSYDNDLAHMVPDKLKIKIVNGDYINLGLLIEISSVDPNDDTKYFSMKEGNLALTPKSKAKVISDVQVWTDAFLIYASIYVEAHPQSRVSLFKYIHTIGLGAGRVKHLGWRDYDIQFRLKKESNPSLSFSVVDQELLLFYMYGPHATQTSTPRPKSLRVMISITRGIVAGPDANTNINA
jgi:hypothetical protein